MRVVLFVLMMFFLASCKEYNDIEDTDGENIEHLVDRYSVGVLSDTSKYIENVVELECPFGLYFRQETCSCVSPHLVDTSKVTSKYLYVSYSDHTTACFSENKMFKLSDFFPKNIDTAYMSNLPKPEDPNFNWKEWLEDYLNGGEHIIDPVNYPQYWQLRYWQNYPVEQPCCLLGDAVLDYGSSSMEAIDFGDWYNLYDINSALEFTLYISQPKPLSNNVWHYNQYGKYDMGRVYIGLKQGSLSTTVSFVPASDLYYNTLPGATGMLVDASEKGYNFKISFITSSANTYNLFDYLGGNAYSTLHYGGYNTMTWGIGALLAAGYPNPMVSGLGFSHIQDSYYSYAPGQFVNDIVDQITLFPYSTFGYGTTPMNNIP